MSLPRSALAAGILLACVATAFPATASATEGTTLQPVCGNQLVTLACDADRVVTTTGPAGTEFTSAAPVGWGALDLERAHHIPTLLTAHDTIGIIDVGADPQLESDLATYRAQYGLPPCATGCFQQMDFHGGPPLAPGTTPLDKAIDEEIAAETSLDVDMASAACPHCDILEVQIPDSEVPTQQPPDFDGYAQAFGVAVQTAIAHGANAVSMSYGLPGDTKMLTGTIAADLDHKGVAITASSGDGAFVGNQWVWPQALPTVTAVGGTELVKQSGSYAEGAWSMAGSSCVPGGTPAIGQPASVTALCGGGRASADISAVADDVAVYDSYFPASGLKAGWQVLAGTSASAPFIAGVYAAAGQLAGVHGPNTLYQRPYLFHDVTSGSNGQVGDAEGDCIPVGSVLSGSNETFGNRMCAAQAGWDGPTGLGTPQGLFGF